MEGHDRRDHFVGQVHSGFLRACDEIADGTVLLDDDRAHDVLHLIFGLRRLQSVGAQLGEVPDE